MIRITVFNAMDLIGLPLNAYVKKIISALLLIQCVYSVKVLVGIARIQLIIALIVYLDLLEKMPLLVNVSRAILKMMLLPV